MGHLGNFNLASALQLAGVNRAIVSNDAAGITPTAMVLESIIPGFSILCQLFLGHYGYDITSLVTRGVLAAGAMTAAKYMRDGTKNMFFKHLCASVTIQPTDRLYREVTGWMSVHVIAKGAQHVAAKSTGSSES